jgi:hypothetical protein
MSAPCAAVEGGLVRTGGLPGERWIKYKSANDLFREAIRLMQIMVLDRLNR